MEDDLAEGFSNFINVFKRVSRKFWDYDRFYFFLWIAGDFVWVLHKVLPAIWINPYLERDLIRSAELLSGSLPLVGPDTISGGYLPGGAYYLLNLPVAIFAGADPYIFSIYTLILRSFAFGVMAWWLSGQLKDQRKTVYLVLFSSLSYLSHLPFVWLNNSSFILILIPFICWLALRYFRSSENDSLRNLGWLSLFLGFSLQVHFSFLCFLPFILVLVTCKERPSFRVFVFLVVSLSIVLMTATPYFLALLNSKYLWWDGPVFWSSLPDSFGFLERYKVIFSNTFPLAGAFTFVHIQLMVLFVYLLYRSVTQTLMTGEKAKVERYLVSCLLGVFVFNVPYFYEQKAVRYFFACSYLTLVLIAIDIGRAKRKWIAWIAFFLIGLAPTIAEMFNTNSHVGKARRDRLTIGGALEICKFFNSRSISFSEFTENTFEVVAPGSEHSYWSSKFCFDTSANPDVSSAQKYLLIDRKSVDPSIDLQKLNLPFEIQSAVSGRPLDVEIQTKDFVLLSYVSPTPRYPILGNLAFSYEFDLGRAPRSQIAHWIDFPLFSKAVPVVVQETNLCNSPFFCSIYVMSQYEKGRLRILLRSRVLQTVWALPPVSAGLEKLKASVVCDGKEREVDLVSRIGLLYGSHPEESFPKLSFRTPWWTEVEISCSALTLSALTAARQVVVMNGIRSKLNNVVHKLNTQTLDDY